tara:strand:- start:35 stop:547 length:513 start_codon:yes stop_codon:yes gene_type:complete
MKRLLIGVSILMMMPFIGCEDKDSDKVNSIVINEVTTDNVNDGPYYYHFENGKVDSSSWHLSYRNLDAGGGMYMPSFSLNSNVMVGIFNSITFDQIETSPDAEIFSPSSGRLSYGGANAVLNYDMVAHKISVSDDNYVIYSTITNKVYKLHFDEYSSGVVMFRYAELDAK